MAQVTTNTEINTINILQEATSVNGTDLFLLQRGSQTFKLQKSNLTFPVGNIEQIGDKKVLGNISGGPSVPYEIDLLDSADADSNRDDALVTEKRVKDIISSNITLASIQHTGTLVTYISGCTISRTNVGRYTVTVPNSGVIPTIVASLAVDLNLSNAGDESFDNQYTISARTSSNTTMIIEITKLKASYITSDGDDDYEVARFSKSYVDIAFQVLISN